MSQTPKTRMTDAARARVAAQQIEQLNAVEQRAAYACSRLSMPVHLFMCAKNVAQYELNAQAAGVLRYNFKEVDASAQIIKDKLLHVLDQVSDAHHHTLSEARHGVIQAARTLRTVSFLLGRERDFQFSPDQAADMAGVLDACLTAFSEARDTCLEVSQQLQQLSSKLR